MARRTCTVVVTGTGFGGRADLIKAHARKGVEVQLRRAAGSHDPQAIGVWVRCRMLWGLWRTWAQIGFIKPDPTDPWAPRFDSGSMRVISASVQSSYAPLEHEHPRVLLRVTIDTD